jgi:predicted metal-binding membrane protein
MSAMSVMPMPGDGTTSMMWTRVPDQTWSGTAASFLGMWVVMTGVMMLPSLAPALWRYRKAVSGTGALRRGCLTALVGVAYFFVWTAVGLATFMFGATVAAVGMRQPTLARLAPIAVGLVVLLAGALQLSVWKARHLARCREALWRGGTLQLSSGAAWRHGLRLGVDCVYSCAGAMAVLLVVGIMDVRAMSVATVAITIERLAPVGPRIARLMGSVAVATGLVLVVRAVAFG